MVWILGITFLDFAVEQINYRSAIVRCWSLVEGRKETRLTPRSEEFAEGMGKSHCISAAPEFRVNPGPGLPHGNKAIPAKI